MARPAGSHPLSSIDTTLLAALLFAYLLYRQSIHRPVTRRDFILPALGALYLTVRYLDGPNTVSQVILQISATVGILSGLMAAGLVRVWRDEKTDLVYQYGGWRYAAVLLVLLLIRVIWHAFVNLTGVAASVAVLNDSLIAVGVGNYLGRTLHVGVRALRLSGWKPHAIPSHREVRRVRSTRVK